MDLIDIFISAFLSHLMKDIPQAWHFKIIKNNRDLSKLVDHATYLLSLLVFSIWFVAMSLNSLQKFTGRLKLRYTLFAAGILMAFAIEAVWTLLLHFVYFLSCRYYPWVTTTIVMWMGMHIPEFVKSQEDVNGPYDASVQQQSASPNRSDTVPTNHQSGIEPAASTSGLQPAPAALFFVQDSVLQHSRPFAAASQEMSGGKSPLGTERPREMTGVPNDDSSAMMERTSVSKTEQKAKRGIPRAVTPSSGGSSSASLSRSGDQGTSAVTFSVREPDRTRFGLQYGLHQNQRL